MNISNKKIKNIHFTGIGGSGMSGIAEVLINLGYEVSGSDIQDSKVIQRLQSIGADIQLSHNRKNLKDRWIQHKNSGEYWQSHFVPI